jgi:hypothetical protein
MTNVLDTSEKGIFLLVLALMGNFLAELLGCKTQKLLSENMLAKHIVCIFTLYFAIDYTSSEDPSHPTITTLYTFLVYILFLLFTKMSITFTIVTFILLACNYIIGSYINYYTQKEPKNPRIKQFEKYKQILYLLLTGNILVGSGLYFKKQRADHHKNWSTIKFFLGVRKCNWSS